MESTQWLTRVHQTPEIRSFIHTVNSPIKIHPKTEKDANHPGKRHRNPEDSFNQSVHPHSHIWEWALKILCTYVYVSTYLFEWTSEHACVHIHTLAWRTRGGGRGRETEEENLKKSPLGVSVGDCLKNLLSGILIWKLVDCNY